MLNIVFGTSNKIVNLAKQILPINIKGLAGSIATLANWFVSWVVTMTANLLLEWSGGGMPPLISLSYSPSPSLQLVTCLKKSSGYIPKKCGDLCTCLLTVRCTVE